MHLAALPGTWRRRPCCRWKNWPRFPVWRGKTPVLVARAGRIATWRTVALPDGGTGRRLSGHHGWRQLPKAHIRERGL